MTQLLKRFVWAALAGALLAMIGGGAWRGYLIVSSGYGLDSVPPMTMAFEVMQLHVLAAWGAAAGVALGLLGELCNLLVAGVRRLLRRKPQLDERPDPDAIIREERARRAVEYLSSLDKRHLDDAAITVPDDQPSVENTITARGGTLTYRVMAYRHLTHDERARVVRDALARGHIAEPEPGGSVTVLTSLGK